ncbi:hypothetical protein L3X38_042936 [Prunus dulcis]|uniref:Integrase catalytic domain-containing protein n=1 Tax=Prunus dulcis TaxID=3755 RepID=A0AAD4UVT1_PRUDU|nr:hypothetical protein L3X38_042936 [Prunus dulcis]
MDPILQFLQNQTLPANPTEAQRVRHRSARYLVINGSLYKRGFSLPYLRCLTPEEGHYVLREIHEGICGNHSGARSLAHKAIRQGYFWPSLHTDAQAFTQKCDKCQRFANIPQLPAEPLTAMVSPWPFAQWGLDLIGPMPEGKGQVKYAVVAVDYFTKWAEAEALATINAARIESFVWQNIVCRFGIPNSIVTDNGRQFDNAKFKQFCSNLKIRLCFASPAHPQSNGQVEAVNKIIKKTLKTKLDKAKGCWPELLPEVLCANGRSHNSSAVAVGVEAKQDMVSRDGPTVGSMGSNDPMDSIKASSDSVGSSRTSSSRKSELDEVLTNLQADPGLRIRMIEYDTNIRDEVRRAYLQKGPCQPRGHSFPQSNISGINRRFIPQWFDEFDWLEYRVSKDAAFCLYCYFFKSNFEQVGSEAFTGAGFKNWKKGRERMKVHVGPVGSVHNKAREAATNLMNQNTHIETAVSKHSEQARMAYRRCLIASIKCTKFLLRQGLSFHGNDESATSSNTGNYL